LVAAALEAQQSAVHLSQHPQSQAPGSQAQTPVAQHPQQSQGVLQLQGLLAANAPAKAIEPAATAAIREPARNLNMLSTPKENSE